MKIWYSFSAFYKKKETQKKMKKANY